MDSGFIIFTSYRSTERIWFGVGRLQSGENFNKDLNLKRTGEDFHDFVQHLYSFFKLQEYNPSFSRLSLGIKRLNQSDTPFSIILILNFLDLCIFRAPIV